MNFETVSLTRTGEVATLTITAPKSALGPLFWQEMPQALTQLQGVRALVVRGKEQFSVGLDVKATAAGLEGALGNRARFRALVAPMHASIEGLARLPFPVIAAVDGWCIGAGLELALACDLRLGSAAARFSLPEVRLGIVADLGGLQRLPRLVGQGWARQLALTGEPLDAATARQIGLVTELHDTPEQLYARAAELAGRLAGLPAAALEGTKRVLNAELPHQDSLMMAVDWNADHMTPEALASVLKR
ncbi:enoyl-CoA hydratase-related protein [Deinococcus sonorensis]|uniref:Enoyl-CoA hydratase-related protein n=2 Tax=Deinococcus sonorensis TaxID=309891 RepID=A0AAU7U7U6_9DEIO